MAQGRRSIQDIIPPARSKPVRTSAPLPEAASSDAKVPPPPPPPPKHPPIDPLAPKPKRSFPLWGIILGIVVLVGVVFAAVSTLLHRATVSVMLNRFPVGVAETFEASPDGVLLSFREHEAEQTLTREVPRTGSEHVEDRARGTITVYNDYSTGNQRLITNTRFESPKGLVYRIKSPIVVPGYVMKNGKRVPGEVEAVVYADEAGEIYNDTPSAFTLPGLKGSPQFEKIYAKSNGPLTGGFIGEKAVIDEAVRSEAVATLTKEAEASVRSSFAEGVGISEMFFPDTLAVTFVEEPDKTLESGAVVSVKAIARAPVFDGEKLAGVIATEGGVSYDGALRLVNPGDLATEVAPSGTEGNLSVTFSGNAILEGVYSKEQLVNDLAGKDRRSVGIVLSGYPAISDMNISVYPFWRGRLPQDIGRITLTEEVATE